jgi:hypothetical protein
LNFFSLVEGMTLQFDHALHKSCDTPHTIRVQETASNATGTSSPATSDPTPVVAAPTVVAVRVGTASLVRVATGPRTVTPTIRCNGPVGASCTAKLALNATETLHGGKVIAITANTHTTKKTVTFGSATVTVVAGQSKAVTISLDRVARRLLATRHRLTAKLTITTGRTTVGTRTLTLLAKRTPN